MTTDDISPADARRTWRSFEAVHGMIYFTALAAEEYAAIGVTSNRTGYFASRSAAMGAVPADVVIATFYNFHPGLVRHAMNGVWQTTTPDAMLAARLRAVDRALRLAFDADTLASTELADAVASLRGAALVACERLEGRPLFAGHAALPWPDEPWLALWHAQTLLRESRGDGHIAALTVEGLSGLDALVSHAASGDVSANVLRLSRAYSEDEWAAGVDAMADRGLVDASGAFTDAGRAQRERIEASTDRAAHAPYAALGAGACTQLRRTGRRLSELVVAAGLMHVDMVRLTE
ncbi:MAG: hypothetical protein JWN99_587 [Ilumatobacteraceae bacterium]|nr:hypothetical protein [Ilumatobacteraceae bacterium]